MVGMSDDAILKTKNVFFHKRNVFLHSCIRPINNSGGPQDDDDVDVGRDTPVVDVGVAPTSSALEESALPAIRKWLFMIITELLQCEELRHEVLLVVKGLARLPISVTPPRHPRTMSADGSDFLDGLAAVRC